jgi:hypothetical protein
MINLTFFGFWELNNDGFTLFFKKNGSNHHEMGLCYQQTFLLEDIASKYIKEL